MAICRWDPKDSPRERNAARVLLALNAGSVASISSFLRIFLYVYGGQCGDFQGKERAQPVTNSLCTSKDGLGPLLLNFYLGQSITTHV